MTAQPARQPAHDDHGHTVEAWTTVAVISIGTVVSAFAFPLGSALVFWVGVAIVVLAAAGGYVWSRSKGDPALSYTDTTPLDTKVEGPTRSSEGTNRP